MTLATPRCASVFTTYAWDGFVERQARRLAEAAGALDLYRVGLKLWALLRRASQWVKPL
jgi:hypothetical protein